MTPDFIGCKERPAKGSSVTFMRGMFGSWPGRVVSVGQLTALIVYTRRNGQRAKTRVHLTDVRW